MIFLDKKGYESIVIAWYYVYVYIYVYNIKYVHVLSKGEKD